MLVLTELYCVPDPDWETENWVKWNVASSSTIQCWDETTDKKAGTLVSREEPRAWYEFFWPTFMEHEQRDECWNQILLDGDRCQLTVFLFWLPVPFNMSWIPMLFGPTPFPMSHYHWLLYFMLILHKTHFSFFSYRLDIWIISTNLWHRVWLVIRN